MHLPPSRLRAGGHSFLGSIHDAPFGWNGISSMSALSQVLFLNFQANVSGPATIWSRRGENREIAELWQKQARFPVRSLEAGKFEQKASVA